MKTVGIVAGEANTQVMELVVPIMERVGNFNYVTAFAGVPDGEGPAQPAVSDGFLEDADAIILSVGRGEAEDREADTLTRELQGRIGARLVIQPTVAYEATVARAPLKIDRAGGTDLVVMHTLGDFYGDKQGTKADGTTYDLGESSPEEIEVVGRAAFELSRQRAKEKGWTPRVTSFDKANVLETSRLWRETMTRLQAEEYPDVRLDHQLIDSGVMELIVHPNKFDVIVSNNMFGDTAAGTAAGIIDPQLVPSASLNPEGKGIYLPARSEAMGSAPAIALSVAMALRHSLDMPGAAVAVEDGVARTLQQEENRNNYWKMRLGYPPREFIGHVAQHLEPPER